MGDPETVAARIQEYADLGIDTFIFSGYPHLEESIRFVELVFPPYHSKHAKTGTATFNRTFWEIIANNYKNLKSKIQKVWLRRQHECKVFLDDVSRGTRHFRKVCSWLVPILLLMIWQIASSSGFYYKVACYLLQRLWSVLLAFTDQW